MTVDTTHRAEQELGPPIVDGVVRWASSTLLTGADHDSEGGCLRRTWFERVGGKDRETTAAMTAGVAMHKEIEAYLTTGQLALGPVAMAGRWAIPEPGPGLVVEQPIILGGDGKITGVWLYCAGVPYAGHVDLYNHRGEYIDPEGELRRDPPGTLEVKDWKSTSDLKWAKTAAQVADTIQMNAYAMAGFRLWPRYDHARLTHVYFQRQKTPQARLVTSRKSREQIEKKWEYAERVMRRVIDAARETDPNHVEANTRACRAYQRDCPHLAYCAAGRAAREFNSLDEVFGARMAERLTRRMTGSDSPDVGGLDIFATTHEETPMGLFEVIKPTTAIATNPAASSAGISLDDLVAEESAARVALDPPPPTPTPATREFAMALGTINASPLGFPRLVGRAAIMFGTLNKHELKSGMVIPARGKLERLPEIEDPAGVVALAEEIARKIPAASQTVAAGVPPITVSTTGGDPKATAQRIEAAIAILPPDAPPSNPALAAEPVEGLDTPKARELEALKTGIPGLAESVAVAGPLVGDLFSGAKPDLFGSPASTAIEAPVPVNPTAPPVEPERLAAPAKAAKPKAKKTTTKTTTAQVGDVATSETTTTEETSGAISIYVDVFADGVELVSLEGYIGNACKILTDEFGGADVRCAPESSALGYSKWKGAVTALVRKHPPGPGCYHVDTRGNEVGELVAVALRQVALESGGVYVRGMR